MAQHRRKSSRGSVFSFSFDAFRSLSRAAIRVPDETEIPQPSGPHAFRSSSLQDQLKQPVDSHPPNESRQALNTGSRPIEKANSESLPKTSRSRIPRPLSWFSVSKPFASKGKVDRSISAPLLTSTTNVNVAHTEGVRCGELKQTDLIQSAWNPSVGWMSYHLNKSEEHVLGPGQTDLTDKIDKVSLHGPETMEHCRDHHGFRIVSKTAFKRVFKHRFNTVYKAGPSPPVPKQEEGLQHGDGPHSPIGRRIARRKAEGLNLCKEKIRELTGHGNVKKKPVQDHIGHQYPASNASAEQKELQPLLGLQSKNIPIRSHTPEHHDSCNFDFGDLERSFANAVNKLDFETTEEIAHAKTPDNQSLASNSCQQESVIRSDQVSHNDVPSTQASEPGPCVYSPAQGRLVELDSVEADFFDTDPVRRSRHPLGLSPTQCHPVVKGFAEGAPRNDNRPSSRREFGTPRIKITPEDDVNTIDLENAPIYSPSSGDLSQYARTSPSPARTEASYYTAPFLSPGNLHEMSSKLAFLDTPTRLTGRGTAAGSRGSPIYGGPKKHHHSTPRLRTQPKRGRYSTREHAGTILGQGHDRSCPNTLAPRHQNSRVLSRPSDMLMLQSQRGNTFRGEALLAREAALADVEAVRSSKVGE